MALDALGRVIVGSGHFFSTAAPLVSQGMQAVGTMVTADRVRHVTAGGGHLSSITRPIEAVAVGGLSHIAVGGGGLSGTALDIFGRRYSEVEQELISCLFSGDDRRFDVIMGDLNRYKLDLARIKSTNDLAFSRLNFPHKIRNGTVRIAGDDRAWEAYQQYVDAQNAHLAEAAKETALAVLSEAAGDTGSALGHAANATSEIAQSVWERWVRDYEQIRDAINQPSYSGFGVPDRDP